MSNQAGHIGIVARQAVCSMVSGHVEVSVNADRAPPAVLGQPGGPGASRAHGALVSVEMTGPDDATLKGNRRASAKAAATAWGVDEIVSAARRAADRILAINPSWRRA